MKCDICHKLVKKAHEYIMKTNHQITRIISYRCKCGRHPVVTQIKYDM